ncbi:MAG: hypothetical protein DRJ05_16160, partial [Bacteroidetes bacterium]
YSAFYIEDEFEYGDFSARVGLRLDYYNANQPVMKDKYSLYETLKKGQITSINGTPVTHPSNIGDDYVVYVDHSYSPTFVTGYRVEDTWYNADGNKITDPEDLDAGSGVSPYLKYPGVRIGDDEWQPDMSFKSYGPVYSFLPQINLNYKFWRMNFYANYNSFSKNPYIAHIFRPEEYWEMWGGINNPALKPYRTDKINLGTNINVYKSIYADISGQKTMLSDYFVIHGIVGAYPHYYYTVVNYYKTIDVNSITATIMFVPKKPAGWSGNVSATKSFMDEEDRRLINSSDFVLNGNLNYDFGYGHNFMFPENKTLTIVFEGFNIGLFYQQRSGTPFPLFKIPVNSGSPRTISQDNGITPSFSFFNLRAEKGFYFKNSGLYLSAYVWVENLFDKRNLYFIYPNTGEPDEDGYLSDPKWQNEIENQVNPESYRAIYQMRLKNPAHYAKPRIWRIGIIAKF